jgi:hypothetical protein
MKYWSCLYLVLLVKSANSTKINPLPNIGAIVVKLQQTSNVEITIKNKLNKLNPWIKSFHLLSFNGANQIKFVILLIIIIHICRLP